MSRRKIIECKAAAAAEADSSDFYIDTCVASSLAVETAKAAAAVQATGSGQASASDEC